MKQSLQYCAARVRQHDYENYLCTFALPAGRRPAALAVRAFNVETAQALGAVTEPHLAVMRLHWWKETVAAAMKSERGDPGDVPGHPVAVALGATVRGSGTRVKRWLEQIVEARIRDAEMVGSPTGIPTLEAYANNTAASLLYVLLDLGGVQSAEADHAAAHLGKAIGIANLLRGTHVHSAQRRCYIPTVGVTTATRDDVSCHSRFRPSLRHLTVTVPTVSCAIVCNVFVYSCALPAGRVRAARGEHGGHLPSAAHRGAAQRGARGCVRRQVASRLRARDGAAAGGKGNHQSGEGGERGRGR